MSVGITIVSSTVFKPHLTVIRNTRSKPSERRHSARMVTYDLLESILRGMPLLTIPFTSGTGDKGEGHAFAQDDVAFVFIMRAALPMALAAWDLMPDAPMGELDLERFEEEDGTISVKVLSVKLPPVRPKICVVLDGMVATAVTTIEALRVVKQWGGGNVRILFGGLVGSDKGVLALHKAHPDVPIFMAAIDPGLDERGFVRDPGVGDFGHMTWGTEASKTTD
ncbi:MAG: uracil phosphoribosyltransferase [bacterium]|nr:uracil phosphoribosyltransferase [bacterium]